MGLLSSRKSVNADGFAPDKRNDTGGLTFLSLLPNLLRDKSLDAASGDTELARNMRGLRTVSDQLSH
jgi:hypothetical protein